MTDTTNGLPTAAEQRPLALVTGASSGIGLEIARELARRGYDLVLNAENELAGAEAAMSAAGATAVPVQADLATPDGVRRLYDAVTSGGRDLDLAVLNAGVGLGGAFVEQDLAAIQRLVSLNVVATVTLGRLLLGDFVRRGSGRLLVTSSIASTMPGSYQAVYNASKSFLQSWVEAVADELHDSEIVIMSLMPGPTDTQFFTRAGMADTPVGEAKKDDPAQVAKQGVDAVLTGKGRVVAGSMKTKVQEAASTVLPDKAKAAAHRAMARPKDE